jgi:HprK-related kinase A
LIVAELPAGRLRGQLASSGLRLRLGPVVAEIRSPFRVVEQSIALHYAAHEVATPADFADFHVAVDAPTSVRRLLRRQALFRSGGHRPFLPLPAAQAFPMLEWGLNWCVSANCHQYLVVHGAVAERGGRAMILPAPPGSGKSTLCAALVARGWRLLSDELTLIDITSGRIVPLPRPISLKNESIEAVRRFWPEAAIGPVVHDTVKGSVAHVRPPSESVRRSMQDVIPGWVVLPRFKAGHPMSLEPVSKAAAFMQMVDSAFNYSIHGRGGFEALADLIAASSCYRFEYGGALLDAVRVLDTLADAR